MRGYAAAHEDKLPRVKVITGPDPSGLYRGKDYQAVYLVILPFLDQSLADGKATTDNETEKAYPHRKLFVSPADPTYQYAKIDDAPVSYAYNAIAYTGMPGLTSTFTDGTSNTIAFVERYFRSRDFDTTDPLAFAKLSYRIVKSNIMGWAMRARTELSRCGKSAGYSAPRSPTPGSGRVASR